jgi:deoxyribose-phosphate aldolase
VIGANSAKPYRLNRLVCAKCRFPLKILVCDRAKENEPLPKTFRKKKRDRVGKYPEYTSTHFEIDRSTVTLQLRNLRRAVDEGAMEMDMVAAERVFGKPVSHALVRSARKLHSIATDLDSLLLLVARAHLPKSK